eukprot:1178909-Prorocentrum_minimum.AAC.4
MFLLRGCELVGGCGIFLLRGCELVGGCGIFLFRGCELVGGCGIFLLRGCDWPVGAQDVANVLWACGTLGFDPEPELMAALQVSRTPGDTLLCDCHL